MILRNVVFLLALTLIVGSASTYVHRKVTRAANLGRGARRALAAVLAAAMALAVASRMLEHHIPASLLAPLGEVGWVVVLTVFITTVLLLLVDLVTAVARRFQRLTRSAVPAPVAPPASVEPASVASPAPVDPLVSVPAVPAVSPVSRRIFLSQATTGSALAIGAGSATYGALFGRHDYILEEVAFAIPGLSRRLDGYTLVQLSDIHLGLFVGEAEMRAAEALVMRAKPDLLVLTGDLIDHDSRQANNLGRLVQRLGRYARDGVVAVPGNHDYYTGIETVVTTLSRAGATVLRNGGRILGDQGASLALLGVDDPWGPREDARAVGPDLDAALAAVPAAADLPRVLLCHNPDYFPAAAGRVGLQLSGHTHGGQIKVGITPAALVLRHGFIAGRYTREGSGLYVNRGFGTAGPPARVGAPPEVTRIVLTV